jgi:predicted PurR-regulated permease PerM
MDLFKLSPIHIKGLIAALLLGSLFFINWPFLMPLLLAALFALGTKDLVAHLSQKLKITYKKAVWLAVSLGLFLFWFPLFIATYRVFVFLSKQNGAEGTTHWMEKMQALKEWILGNIQHLSESLGIDLTSPIRTLLENTVTVMGQMILKITTEFFQQLPVLFMASLVFTISLFVFLYSAPQIKSGLLKLQILPTRQLEGLVEAAQKSCRMTLFSTIVVGLVQATFIGLGSLVFNQGDFWLVMIITFFISFIPVVGAAPMGFILAVLAYIDGHTGSSIGLAVVAILAGTVDNFLKPLMVSSLVQAPAILAFTSVIGAVLMLGIPGLIIGPIVLNLALLVIPLLSEETSGE